jgi:hypothetical protein
MNPLVLVVDDEPDVEDLFRQQFKRDIRAGRFTMEFAGSGDSALQGLGSLTPRSHFFVFGGQVSSPVREYSRFRETCPVGDWFR